VGRKTLVETSWRNEKIFLPIKNVTIYKQFTVEADIIGHSVTYISTTNKEVPGIQHGSYIRILDSCNKIPILGQIDMCFTHEFETRTTKFTMVRILEDVQLDPESKLWWVPIKKETSVTKLLIPLTYLSPPLVTARLEDEEKLWFLTI